MSRTKRITLGISAAALAVGAGLGVAGMASATTTPTPTPSASAGTAVPGDGSGRGGHGHGGERAGLGGANAAELATKLGVDKAKVTGRAEDLPRREQAHHSAGRRHQAGPRPPCEAELAKSLAVVAGH